MVASPSTANPASPPDEALVREALAVLDRCARTIAKQLGGRYTLDDLRGFGHTAIVDLVARFDRQRGVAFAGYARFRLRGAILDGLRREAGLPRSIAQRIRMMQSADRFAEGQADEIANARPTSAQGADARLQGFLQGLATACATGMLTAEGAASHEGPEGDDKRRSPETIVARKQARDRLEQMVLAMPEPDRTILHRHYFLDEDLQDAARAVGLSKGWGSRVHSRAIARLASSFRALTPDDL